MGMEFKRKLPIPMDIKKQYPIGKKEQAIKMERDAEIKKIFTGESKKFLLIIGPCSADYQESVL
jgi:3-deoxy-7-phosphoheptulonate synthase